MFSSIARCSGKTDRITLRLRASSSAACVCLTDALASPCATLNNAHDLLSSCRSARNAASSISACVVPSTA